MCETLGGCDFDLEGTSLRHPIPADRLRRYWRYSGGSKDRFAGGIDRFHEDLDTWWDVRTFSGDLTALARSLFPGKNGISALTLKGHLDFSAAGNSSWYTLDGWGESPEEWGTWTVGERASLLLPIAESDAPMLRLTLNARAFLPTVTSDLTASISINGTSVGSMHYVGEAADLEQSFLVPRAVAARNGRVMQVDLDIDHPRSRRQAFFDANKDPATAQPADYDTRKLGLGVRWLKLEPAGRAQ